MEKNKIEETKKNSKNITIKTMQAAEIYKWNKKKSKSNGASKEYLYTKEAVIGKSILSSYLRGIGVTMERGTGTSYDLINLKFDYGVKDTITAEKLRELYYSNGVSIYAEDLQSKAQKEKDNKRGKKEQLTYKMLYRNTGKAKEGQCIFIREEYYKKVLDYMTMGLYEKMQKMQKNNARIVEMSAYAPLISATAMDYIQIPMENIFVVKDRKATVKKDAVVVKTKEIGSGESARTECYAEEVSAQEITNTLWDGMGLIDESMFPPEMDGFIYCRSHFFKSCLFRGNVQDYFRDHYDDYETATVKDMFGRKFRVKDIKVLVTENSLKWYKFIDLMGGTPEKAFAYYEKWMKKDGEIFSIIKTGHESKWGELQRSSYQINNSLPTTDEEILKKIAQVSIDYCNQLKLSDDAFMEYLRSTATKYNINNVLLALDEHTNENIRYTELFSDKKRRVISNFKTNRLMVGKLLQQGDNLVICGNPLALLEEVKVTDREENEKEPVTDGSFMVTDEHIECYAARFKEGEYLAGFRSPHNSPNNIVHLKNVYSEQLLRYFPNLGKHVIVVNGIGTDIQDRMNSMDMDSDSMYVTNQEQIAKLAKQAYLEYPTIINGIIDKSNSEYTCDMQSYAVMDNKIASAQIDIGQASDLAQLALSYYYNGGSTSKELKDVFIICSVLAQCAIDGAKRIFDVDTRAEIKRLQNLDSMKNVPAKYPVFLAKIKNEERRKQGKKQIKDENIVKYNCPMDILYDIIDKKVVDLRNLSKSEKISRTCFYMPLLWNFNVKELKEERAKRTTKAKVVSIVKEFTEGIEELKKEDLKEKEYPEKANRLYEKALKKLERITITKELMQTFISSNFVGADLPGMYEKMLIMLYNKDAEMFLNCYKSEPIIIENKEVTQTSKIA